MPPLQGTPTRALPQSLTPEQPLSTRVVLRAPGGRTKRPRHLTRGKKASGSACALDWERAMQQVNAATPASGRRTLWDLRWARSRAQRMRGNSPAPVPCGWSPRWPRPWVTSASAARTVGSQQSAGTWGEARRNREPVLARPEAGAPGVPAPGSSLARARALGGAGGAFQSPRTGERLVAPARS